MKKFIILIICICMLCCSCNQTQSPHISKKVVFYITMKTTYYDMPQKIITTKKDFIDIINYINNIPKKNIDMEQLRGGDTFWIQTYDENDYMIDSVMFQGKYLNINGKMYQISEDVNDKMIEIYDSLDYPETKWEENCLDATIWDKPYKRK